MDTKWKALLGVLALSAFAIWLAAGSANPTDKLRIIACDVGQGDAILATLGESQILFDGGPNSEVIKCLEANMPFWDRTVEVVVNTHPQFDHYRGLIDVFERYAVHTLIATGLESDAAHYQEFKRLVAASGARVVSPSSAISILVGEVKLSVVHPDTEFQYQNIANGEATANVLGAYTTKRDPNDYSVVVKLTYGDFDALFTGDIGPGVTDEIMTSGLIDESEYLKVPHHGSKNGLTQELLHAVNPEVAVISAGKDNRFGHPHKEILEMLNVAGVSVFRTDTDGEVKVVSDGKGYWVTK